MVKKLQSFFKQINSKKYIFFILLALTIVSGLLASYLLVVYYVEDQSIQQQAKDKIEKNVKEAAQSINTFLQSMQKQANSLAQDISGGKISKEKIIAALKKIPADTTGIGVAFAPYAYDSSKKFYAPYFVQQRSKQANILKETPTILIELEDYYDYTDTDFYKKTMADGASFIDPFFDPATNATIIGYATPIVDANKKTIGIVYVMHEIHHVTSLLKGHHLYTYGYPYILSKNGRYIGHPIAERNSKTVFEVARELQDTALAKITRQVLSGQKVFAKMLGTLKKEKTWQFFEPIPSAGWALVTVSYESALNLNPKERQRQFNNIFFALLLFLILLCLLLLRVYQADIWRLWTGSIVVSLFFLYGIVFMWHVAYMSVYQNIPSGDFIIKDRPGLIEFINKTEQKSAANNIHNNQQATTTPAAKQPKKFTLIPTGLLLQHISIDSFDSIKIIGEFWQRYPKDFQKNLEQGFILPYAYEIEATKSYQFQDRSLDVQGWRIVAKIDQDFSYDLYPFDIKLAQIVLWPADFDKKIVLIPDIEAYPMISPKLLPGLDTTIRVPGWQIYETFFTCRAHNYSTNFGNYVTRQYGISDLSTKSQTPQLVFNIILRRLILSSLILNLSPILFIILTLFILLLLIHKKMIEKVNIIFRLTISLFFSTILTHIRFKSTVPANNIIFFEYFYFILYVAVFLTMLVATLHYMQIKNALISYRNLLIPLVSFWPAFTCTIFIMSVISFY